jgi:hypothetical protein
MLRTLAFLLAVAGLLAALRGAAPAQGPTAPPPSSKPAGFDHDHSAWTGVLSRHVRGDRFDYRALKEDRAGLDAYLKSLEAVTKAEFDAWTREQRFAFWINAYNAYTIRLVLDAYPVDSIKDIGGLLSSPWKKAFIPLSQLHPASKGRKLTLDDVEHSILRPTFEDARVHVAVNCASRGCPPLLAEAFAAERLDDQLDAQMRAFLADTSRNRIDAAGRKLELSSIFDWFGEDFERDAGDLKAYLARYLPGDEASKAWIGRAKVSFLDYSWKLNDVERE